MYICDGKIYYYGLYTGIIRADLDGSGKKEVSEKSVEVRKARGVLPDWDLVE